MLQRIQSVYLLFASLTIFALFLFPLAHDVYISGVPSTIKVTGIYQDAGGAMKQVSAFTPLTIGTVVTALLPIVLIFLFKNRKQQVLLCYLVMLLIILFAFWEAQTVKEAVAGYQMRTSNYGIGVLLSTISLVFILMAIRGIRKDDSLVRSADRLR